MQLRPKKTLEDENNMNAYLDLNQSPRMLTFILYLQIMS